MYFRVLLIIIIFFFLLKKSRQPNLVSKSDTATKTSENRPTLKKVFNVMLRCECSVKSTLTSSLVCRRQQCMIMNTAYNREDNDRAKSNAYIDVSQSKRNVLRCKNVGPLHTENTKHSDFNQMSSIVTKQTKWHMRPAKTHISLGIRPV